MKKTTFTFIVLSEDPIHERMDIGDVIRECDEGDFVLYSLRQTSETLTPQQMAHALLEAGSDPTFFQLNT